MSGDMSWPGDDPLSGADDGTVDPADPGVVADPGGPHAEWDGGVGPDEAYDDAMAAGYEDREYDSPDPGTGEPTLEQAGWWSDPGLSEPSEQFEQPEYSEPHEQHSGPVEQTERVGETEPMGSAELVQPVETDGFPPPLNLDVLPGDGGDWVDPSLLGAPPEGGSAALIPLDPPQALLADLHEADQAEGEPSWQAATASEDPAVRALALLWAS